MTKPVTKKVRDVVYGRDPACIVRGVLSFNDFGLCQGVRTVQHTVGKGMGGSKMFDTADLLVSMCSFHNHLLTSDASFQAFGKRFGWVKNRNDVNDPRQTPVLYWDGWHRLVGDDRIPVPTPDALEYMASLGLQVF